MDFRTGARGPLGSGPLYHPLPADRDRGERDACYLQLVLADAGTRSVRRNRRHHCGLRPALSIRIRVLVLIVFIPLFFSIPAMLFAGVWFFTQLLQGTSELFSPFAGDGIAWWAHIGGFVSGWWLLLLLEQSGRLAVRYNGGPWER